jgi:7-alpha-hydroxysteroid dehydrogenase
MEKTLDGASALVTGGGTGIGKGIARRLLEVGAVVTIASRRAAVLETAAEELRAEVAGAVVDVAVCDVTRGEDVKRAVELAARRTGRLDVAVANAGGGTPYGLFLDLDEADWRAALELNLLGTANTFREAARAMRDGGGALVAISSETAVNPGLGCCHYATAKAAVDYLVRCLAIELAPFGIRVNSVRPGPTEGGGDPFDSEELNEAHDEFFRGEILGGVLLERRCGTPREIADTVLHLVGPAGSWITGQAISVDGGYSVRPGSDLRGLIPLVEKAAEAR